MLKLSKRLALMMLILVFACPGFADEGMWMPHQMKELNLKAKGLTMNPGDLYKKDGTGLMSAVVYMRGSTGAFVSSEGLILTNHHVAFRAIQRASDKEHDYIKNGFLAGSTADEIPARGNIVDVLLDYEDVTPIVMKKLKPGMTPGQRYKTLEGIKKKLIAKAEKKGKDLRCSVKSMYKGNKYYLFKSKRLRDIRLVYAPPQSIGNFGGEIDNWMWPRHTCDFTFLRAYVSKDNQGTAHSPDNVPYQPKSVMKISVEGVKEGDFTFIMGYPGTTRRNYTLSELQFEIEKMKRRVNDYKGILSVFEEAGENDRAIEIKYASLVKGVSNALKNRMAQLEGFRKESILDKKRAFEKKFMEWVGQQPQRKKKYNDILTKIENFMRRNADFYLKKQQLDGLVRRRIGPALLAQAHLVYRAVEESQKPDIQRESGFQKRDRFTIENRIKLAERGYELETDKTYLKFLLKKLLKQGASQYPKALIPMLEKGSDAVDAYVDKLYSGTIMKDAKRRLELIKLKPAVLLKLNDPFIKLAVDLEKELKVLRDKENIVDQQREDLKMIYMAAMLEMHKGKIAPDANASIRFTYGYIKGYHPRDAVTYRSQTTLQGIMEKETGEFPFEVPEKLKALYRARDFGGYKDNNLDDIATCFLNTTNVTGGSSGSPVLNAGGEQVGIAFDMTYESVIGDYFIIPGLQRVISVDMRYVLFITEKFSRAHHLLKEMKLK